MRVLGKSFIGLVLIGLFLIVGCGGGGGNDGGGDGNVDTGTTYTASGTYTYDPGTGILTLNITSSDFECEGPEIGTDEFTVLSLTSTTMTWQMEDGDMTWTRDSGISGDIVGTWESYDDESGNSWEGTFESNSSFSMTGQIVQCENGDSSGEREFEPLGFPFSTPSHIVELAAFGIPNWSGAEPHNGIDLIVDENLTATKIISPTAGEITSIVASENPFSDPPNQLLLSISIHINSEWEVVLVLEPGTNDNAVISAQIEAVEVTTDQTVNLGDEIADLLIGDLGYPHLHYMLLRNGEDVCAYKYSLESAKQIFEDFPKTDISDGYICYGEE